MTTANLALLPDRGVVAVTGPDAGKLLQGMLTNDVDLWRSLATAPERGGLTIATARYAALLSPQGKILVDMIATPVDAADPEKGYLLDVPRHLAPELAKRLNLYKLRAKVTIEDASAHFAVYALWGGDAARLGHWNLFADPRLAALGHRFAWRQPVSADVVAARQMAIGQPNDDPSPLAGCDRLGGWVAPHLTQASDYHAHRIALGVPEGGRDYAFGDTFPHEALLDQLNGVSFSKGCYVGQEIVSRMEHRGTARKRVVPVQADMQLPASGTEVRALDPVNGPQLIGTLGSTDGTRGLALLRLDRAAELEVKGARLTAADVPLRVAPLPGWVTFTYPPKPAAAAPS